MCDGHCSTEIQLENQFKTGSLYISGNTKMMYSESGFDEQVDYYLQSISQLKETAADRYRNAVDLPSSTAYSCQYEENQYCLAIYKVYENVMGQIPYCISTSNRATSSKTPFSQLTETVIGDLGLEVQAKYQFIVVRVLQPMLVNMGLSTVVKDQVGAIIRLEIQRYPVDEIFYAGSVLIIKEPWVRLDSLDMPFIKVESPTDVILLTKDHPLNDQFCHIRWEIGEPDLDQYEWPISAEEWKTIGQLGLKCKYWPSALESFQMAAKVSDDENFKNYCMYVIAYIYANLNRYEQEAATLLEIHRRSLHFTSGPKMYISRPFYDLRRYDDSYIYHCHHDQLYSKDETRDWLLNQISARINEKTCPLQELTDNLHRQMLQNPHMELECSNRTGPVVKFKGFPFILAAEDIESGSLILVSKAIVSNLNRIQTTGSQHDYDGIIFHHREYELLVTKLSNLLFKNFESFSKEVYELPAVEGPIDIEYYCDQDRTEPIVDVELLQLICRRNAISIEVHCENENPNKESIGLGLFTMPSYCRHSCQPNTVSNFYNDILVLTAGRFIARGEPISMAFVSGTVEYEKRAKLLAIREMECDCRLCESYV